MPEKELQRLRVILIGSGNVASNLGQALIAADTEIVQVYSRKIANAKALAKKLKAKVITDLSKIDKRPALIIIAVKDDAIEAVVKKLKANDGIVVHTSGSVSMDVLKKFEQHGVFYPLQTFSKDRTVDFSNVPICIEGSDTSTLLSLTTVAETLSECVYNLDSKQRQAAHLAAVFANNFTNHIYSISEEILNEHKLPFDLIRPLIDETALKVMDDFPRNTQTGPAARKDTKVMTKQRAMLKKYPQAQKLYNEISADIIKKSSGKKK
ncbi:MAG: DUF2520 domain-containing protein [Bacteroidota bacterium]|nr:DUF2520 domain-containing protein [Bacteroidota bacterium]